MSGDLIGLIEAIHDASINGDLWPSALAGVTQLLGGIGATIEVTDRSTYNSREFYGYGIPRPEEIAYLSHYAALNPRVSAALRQKPGDIAWDYQILDEGGIDRSLFYREFLARLDMRYAVAGILTTAPHEFGAFAVQRSAAQGHVSKAEITLMRTLTRHVSQALDVTRRLRVADTMRQSLEAALDWLADGVILLDVDGRLVYANQAFETIAAARDGIAVKRSAVEFARTQARHRFATAWSEMLRFRKGDARSGGTDFAVTRRSGAPAYLVSLRPLLARRQAQAAAGPAFAILLVRDPLKANSQNLQIFREVLGLSEAEASLALAMQGGTAPNEYARDQRLSANTVYTHLKRIKEKTGCHRSAELIRRLNDLQMVPLTDLLES